MVANLQVLYFTMRLVQKVEELVQLETARLDSVMVRDRPSCNHLHL